jgi:hypothetical protein
MRESKQQRKMEIEDTPYIGFPLGLALLVFLLFFICCFFCCCLYWDKLQFLFPSYVVNVINPQPRIQAEFATSHHKPGFPVLVITSLANTYTIQKPVISIL